MVAAIVLWLAGLGACAMLFSRTTRHPAYFALAGTGMGLLYHYDIGTIPEVRSVAVLFWAAAALILADRALAIHRRRSA